MKNQRKDALLQRILGKAASFSKRLPRQFIFVLLLPFVLGACSNRPSPAVKLTESMGDGLHGYIRMKITQPAKGYGYGFSFYSGVWPLLGSPLKSFQIGLPGTWVVPDNRGYKQPLCPHGTLARDHWPKRGPSYWEVFQTIEGGGGFWTGTHFPSVTPKYLLNGTNNCYNYMISSPGWGYQGHGKTLLSSDKMAIVQLSNRLLVPPEPMPFKTGMNGQLLGAAWMALPLMHEAGVAPPHGQPTGDNSWTLFLNSSNFKGPVAFWLPSSWSAIAKGYPPAAGRTLDAREGVMDSTAMEVNTVPYFSNKDKQGVLYSRIPKLLFPTDSKDETVFVQDVRLYSRAALYNAMKGKRDPAKTVTGVFNQRGALTPSCKNLPLKFDQHGVPLTGFGSFVETTMLGGPGSCAYGLKWKGAQSDFPQYFKQDGKKMTAVTASEVPKDTRLQAQTFAPATPRGPYTSPTKPGTSWTTPGPKSGPFKAMLSDGSTVTYYWYRFVDQPALQHLDLSKAEKARLQSLVEGIQANWPITRNYMAPPSSGKLATFDPALIVTPPRGMEVGYVPIVTRQELSHPQKQTQ